MPVSARTGAGPRRACSTRSRKSLDDVGRRELHPALVGLRLCAGCRFAARYDWAESVSTAAVRGDASAHGRRTEAIDRVLTHKVVGLACFAAVMALVFMLIFWVAQYPDGPDRRPVRRRRRDARPLASRRATSTAWSPTA